MTWRSVTLALAATLALLIPSLPAAAASKPVGELQVPRAGHSATRLWGGAILVVGGERRPEGRLVRRAELFDPTSGRVRSAGTAPFGVSGHTGVALPDRRVLIVGGHGGGASCDRYPALLWHGPTKRFTRVRALPDVGGASATRLRDGRVLIAGGGTRCRDGRTARSGTRRAVLYDPATGRTTPTGALAEARGHQLAIRLRDGRVLVVDGLACDYRGDLISCEFRTTVELYDPATGTWQVTGRAPILRSPRLSRLRDGTVVLSGAARETGADGLWTWDPGSGDFVPASARPHSIPSGHVPIVLDGDRLAMVGGDRGDGSGYRAVNGVRTWDQRADGWSVGWRPGPPVIGGHTATASDSGPDVFLIGGYAVRSNGSLRAIARVTRWRMAGDVAPAR